LLTMRLLTMSIILSEDDIHEWLWCVLRRDFSAIQADCVPGSPLPTFSDTIDLLPDDEDERPGTATIRVDGGSHKISSLPNKNDPDKVVEWLTKKVRWVTSQWSLLNDLIESGRKCVSVPVPLLPAEKCAQLTPSRDSLTAASMPSSGGGRLDRVPWLPRSRFLTRRGRCLLLLYDSRALRRWVELWGGHPFKPHR
jgi:hypothetical protein